MTGSGIPGTVTKHSRYRQRGFACSKCHAEVQLMGSDPVEVSCPVCNSVGTLAKVFDHLVTQVVYVDQFVESGAI